MFRISNALLAIFNGIILVISLIAICTGLYFLIGSNSQCEKGVENQLLMTGAALFLVSLIGLIGSCYKINFFLIIYLIIMFVLILFLICFTLFTIFVTNEGVGKAFSSSKIMNFNTWIKDHFVNDENWFTIKECLIDAKVCKSLGNEVDPSVSGFYKNLSPIQSGCCKPPAECGFQYQNATFWIEPKKGVAVTNSDCSTWSNEQQTLCYDCDSCKDGIVNNVRHKWKALAIGNVCITIVIIVLYSVGCCAFKSYSGKKNYGKYTGGYRSYA